MTVAEILPILPELILAVGAMGLLMLGVFYRRAGQGMRVMAWNCVGLLMIVALVVLLQPGERVEMFNGAFVMDGFARFMKILVMIGSAAAIVMSLSWSAPGSAGARDGGLDRFEFPILITLAALGMSMMISANDLISMYLAMELQGLTLYVIAAFHRDSGRASEAGLKYFVLGALSSGMLLYGCSLIYGFAGHTGFVQIAAALGAQEAGPMFIIGLVFILAGMAFKVSAVPFHMWTPDVYEGAPTPVTAFLAGAPKIAAMALFIRITIDAFAVADDEWRQVVVFLAVASMLLGSFAALAQRNIKRLMAYSSIAHMGFALVGLAPGTSEGIRGVILYMVIYLVMNIGTFCCILAMRRKDGAVTSIDELAGLGRRQPVIAFLLAALMFSLAGIPPLAGFFAKFYVFLAAVEAGFYPLAVIGVLASVVAAFYYVRIVKIIYVDDPAPDFTPMSRELAILTGVSGAMVLLFFAWPSALIEAARIAASVLFS